MSNPKRFSWKVTVQPKRKPNRVQCQEQCSSNSGEGNGQCGSG